RGARRACQGVERGSGAPRATESGFGAESRLGMKRIFAQTRKELTQLGRDRLALALALALPVFQLLLMGSSISMVVRDLPLVVPAVRFCYNPGLSSRKFYGPGVSVMAMSMFPPLLATLAMAREGERKTILQVHVSNISAFEFLLGKVLAFVVVACAECVLL